MITTHVVAQAFRSLLKNTVSPQRPQETQRRLNQNYSVTSVTSVVKSFFRILRILIVNTPC